MILQHWYKILNFPKVTDKIDLKMWSNFSHWADKLKYHHTPQKNFIEVWQVGSSHWLLIPSILYNPFSGVGWWGGNRISQLLLGKRQGPPWTGRNHSLRFWNQYWFLNVIKNLSCDIVSQYISTPPNTHTCLHFLHLLCLCCHWSDPNSKQAEQANGWRDNQTGRRHDT